MKPISIDLNINSEKKLYIQIYEHIRDEISTGKMLAGERLPSVRMLAEMLNVSTTTVRAAYDQLAVEGYLISRPQSGFYVADGALAIASSSDNETDFIRNGKADRREQQMTYCDPETFDFVKWKKCMASVLNERPEQLLSIGDKQGEPELRQEIAGYLYTSRGVVCTPDDLVISAGTQQLMDHLARILRTIGVGHICTEDPGYMPVRNVFRERGFSMSHIPVAEDGIVIEKLPVNIQTAVYISPQNQFPTGAVMPISRRHEILRWAERNNSVIIEDVYYSGLSYSGQPVPALQGLDHNGRVVYLGSFTSTLFPAVRISYMVLPANMSAIFGMIKRDYDQTCSKTEQLTLAEFMRRGYYQINLRRIRKLYSKKLQTVMSAVKKYGAEDGLITAQEAASGTNMILKVDGNRLGMDPAAAAGIMIRAAASHGLKMNSLTELDRDGYIYLNFHYNQIPVDEIDGALCRTFSDFRQSIQGDDL